MTTAIEVPRRRGSTAACLGGITNWGTLTVEFVCLTLRAAPVTTWGSRSTAGMRNAGRRGSTASSFPQTCQAADLEAFHKGLSLGGVCHVHGGRHWRVVAVLLRLCALGLVTLLENLPQLFLAPAKVFHFGLDSSRSGIAAIRGGQSIPTNVPDGLVGDVRLRGCRVVKKRIAINHNVLQSHS